MSFCNCCGEPAEKYDRNGLFWCDWCHDNGWCTDLAGHLDLPTARKLAGGH